MGQTYQRYQNRLAAAIVLHRDSVLLVRRSMTERFLPGIWGIPCGKLEPGEQPASGALRELKEETGLTGRIRRLAGYCEFISEWNGKTVHNTQKNYLVEPLNFEITLPHSDQAFRWIPVDQLDNAGLDDHNFTAIKQGLSAGCSAKPPTRR